MTHPLDPEKASRIIGNLLDACRDITRLSLIDVKGYANNPTYKLFYAVFYVQPGIWVRKRFEEVWKQKEFPENWKGIFVEGI